MKVGALLAVGFGEAGSEIIAENIKKGGSVDPMIPGKKILAIFGFCDIRNFTDVIIHYIFRQLKYYNKV